MLSVYISNEKVQIVNGSGGKKVKLKRVIIKNIPEGLLINGIIIDESALADILADIWNEYRLPRKNVAVVVDSSQIYVKNMTIPNLSDAKCIDMIRNEYAANENVSDMIFDYIVLEENKKIKKQTVMGISMGTEMIRAYIELFRKARVAISSVNVSVCAALDIIRRIPDMAQSTCILSILDGTTINTIFTVNGKYSYSTRSRVFNDIGTPEFSSEIGQIFNKIIQFHASEKIESPISGSFIAGMSDVYARRLCEDIKSSMGIQVSPLPVLERLTMPPESKIIRDKSETDLSEGDIIYPIGNLSA